MARAKPISLTEDDFEILLPGRDVQLGNTVVRIVPLQISDLTPLGVILSTAWPDFAHAIVDRGITKDNYRDHFADLLEIMLDRVPQIIEMLSGVDVASIRRLPLITGTDLLQTCIEVNMRDRDFFDWLSDLRKIMDGLQDLAATRLVRSQESATSSSDEGIPSQKSEDTALAS